MSTLTIYNTYSRQKELFQPLAPPFVGLYLCGPTVYGEPHLGHARPAIVFDVLFRYLKHLGYKVRYVRNITDVGHLENDADEGEDKIAKKARLEQVEPMEVAQQYTDSYHAMMDKLNVQRPSIEPRATGHIPEQIAMIQQILANGYAYVVDGSVYFDVPRYQQDYPYGKLSGRENVEELIAGSRANLEGGTDKRHPADFALWKKANPSHIMQWESPWGRGFPGWHIECSAMSTKYLGAQYDIHGGGLDLMFPHHESEIAQANACNHPHAPTNEARYWMHNNLVTVNGQKMGKSLGNFINLNEVFSGSHALLERAYSPMTVRFYMLQAHYRSTLDLSNEALQAAEKGYKRLMNAIAETRKLKPAAEDTFNVSEWENRIIAALNDDLNTAVAIAELFEGARLVFTLAQGTDRLTADSLEQFRQAMHYWPTEVLGLTPEAEALNEKLDATVQLLIELRLAARRDKNFALSDEIRDRLKASGILLRDTPEGTSWALGE